MLEKKTKIICSVSDRNCSTEFIRSLYEAGMNVVRINSAHTSLESSLEIVKNVMDWRKDGIPCFATLDAGPNVHMICPASVSIALQQKLEKIPRVKEIIRSDIGGAAVLV